MEIQIDKLQEKLCNSFCTEITVTQKNDDLIRVETPFLFPDGDPYQIYIRVESAGVYRLTDAGHTFMQLSYLQDYDTLRKGNREQLLSQIKLETGLKEDEGEFYIETSPENLSLDLFRFGQALTKIYDLTFLNRSRVESTFYEDLRSRVYNIVEEEKVHEDYVYEEMEDAEEYPIDYFIEGKHEPLYLFAIPNRDKSRLTTIVLEHLLRHTAEFNSLLVFEDVSRIPKKDFKRLMNVGGEMISSLDAENDLNRKITKRVANNGAKEHK